MNSFTSLLPIVPIKKSNSPIFVYFIILLSFASLFAFNIIEEIKISPVVKASLFYLQFLGYFCLLYVISKYILDLYKFIDLNMKDLYDTISQSVLLQLFESK